MVKKANVANLIECASLMGLEERGLFERVYGNILQLLQLDIQEDAVKALSQFYDPDIRCFIFEDFQLSPTLEEYEQILGFSRSESVPYQCRGRYYSDQRLSLLLQVGVGDLKVQKERKNRIMGFPLSYFEALMKSHAQADRWGPFKQLLALTVFGIVLFPQVENFIDETAIGVFLAFISKDNPINPVPAVLADTYYSFTHHRVLGKKKIACSLHVLYAWFLNHFIAHKNQATNLLEYAMGCEVEVKSAQEWVHTLGSFNALKVRWYTHSCWKDRPSIVFQCGDFQNVPLMGTQGCVNYNPSLTIRQLGYPMRNMPTKDMLATIFLSKEDPKNEGVLRKISKAWENVVRKDKDELMKKIGNVTFYQWLHERIQSTRPPSQEARPVEREMPEIRLPTTEELNEAKSALAKAEEEKRALQAELEKVILQKKKLEEENEIKTTAIEESVQQFKAEKKSKLETQKHLQGARDELQKYKQRTRKALEEARGWKMAAGEPKQESRLVVELKNQLKSLEHERNSIGYALKEYQEMLGYEQERSDELKRHCLYLEESYRRMQAESRHWEQRFLALIGKIEEQEIVRELRDEIQLWKGKFSRLAWLANQAVKDVPRRLRRAEAEMFPFNTPVHVYEFVNFCKTLTEELMEKAEGAAAASKERKKKRKLEAICY